MRIYRKLLDDSDERTLEGISDMDGKNLTRLTY
jgi:hypothetical protein